MFAKSQKASKFQITKVRSLRISNPDSVVVKGDWRKWETRIIPPEQRPILHKFIWLL